MPDSKISELNTATAQVGDKFVIARSGDNYQVDYDDVREIEGPSSSISGNIVVFDGTTGKVIKDGLNSISDLLDRSNHTGTQTASTISDFDTEVANNPDVEKIDNKSFNTNLGTSDVLYPTQNAVKTYVDNNSGTNVGSLDDLTDVSLTTPSSGEAVVYDGTNWTNQTLPGGGDMLKSTYDTDGNGLVDNADYDNATSGLTATDTQGAIDEIAASYITADSTDTLTNKTINFDNNTINGTLQNTDVKQTNGIGETVALEIDDTSGLPQISFIDETVDVGKIIGENNYSINLIGSTFTVDGIRTTGGFISGASLISEGGLVVNGSGVVGDGFTINRDTVNTSFHNAFYNDGILSGQLYSDTNNDLYWKPNSETAIQLDGGTSGGIDQTEFSIGTVTTNTTIDRANGRNQEITIGASVTLTFNFTSAGFIQLEITNGGDYTTTWGNTIQWAEGTAPSLTSGGTDIVNIWYDGSVYKGDYGYNFA